MTSMVLAGIILVTLLFVEYRFFYAQAQKMIELQEEYRSYVDVLKKKVIEADTTPDKEKDECSDSVFPEGARVYTSESDCGIPDSFIVVNRKADYLKQSTLAYFKEQKLDHVAQELHNYNQQTLQRPRKKIRFKTRRRIAHSNWMPRRLRNRMHIGLFDWPIEKTQFWLSSFFGPRRKPNGTWRFHYGVDMAAVKGTPVHAAGEGVVIEARYVSGYGNTVLIAHNNDYKTRYAHLNTITVKSGQRVEKGHKLGTVGATGFTIKSGRDASHLHFEVYERGKHVDPLYLLV